MNDPAGYDNRKRAAVQDAELLIPPLLKTMNLENGITSTILDFGCGTGLTAIKYLLPIAESTDSRIVGLDISESMVQYAQKIHSHPKILYICEDILSEGSTLKEGDFDHIFSFHVLHWIKDSRNGFKRFFEVLKPGGTIGFTMIKKHPQFPLYKSLAEDPKWSQYNLDYKRYTPTWIEREENGEDCMRIAAIEAGFNIFELNSRTHTYEFSSFKEFHESIFTLVPFIDVIPKELHKDLKRSTLSYICQMYKIPENERTLENPFLLEYELIVGVLAKPKMSNM